MTRPCSGAPRRARGERVSAVATRWVAASSVGLAAVFALAFAQNGASAAVPEQVTTSSTGIPPTTVPPTTVPPTTVPPTTVPPTAPPTTERAPAPPAQAPRATQALPQTSSGAT